MAITLECWEQYWTSPGINTPQDTNYTANCLPSRKLYKLDEPDTQDTAGEARTNSSVMYSYGPPHMAKQKQDDQIELTHSSYVRIWDVTLKTCQKRWMIGRSGERGSGISVLATRLDDDDSFAHCQLVPSNTNNFILHTVKWFQVLLCITNNSNNQFKYQTVLFDPKIGLYQVRPL